MPQTDFYAQTTLGALVAVTRNLHDALMDARVYVAAEAVLANSGLGHPDRTRAPYLLDRIDGALADAGELLGGRTP